MEQQNYSNWDIPLYISNPLYQMVSILLILKICVNSRSKSASIGRIQLYLWGLASNDNTEKLKKVKQGIPIEDIPVYVDSQICEIVRQCVKDGYIVVKTDSKATLYYLAKRGTQLLDTLSRTDLYKDIYDNLKEIDYIPQTTIDNLNIDWYATI